MSEDLAHSDGNRNPNPADDSSAMDRDAQIVSLLTDVQLPLNLYVRSLLPGNSMARDVAQQANVKIWEKRNDFELGTNFKAWAFTIARFEVLNFRKRNARDAKLMFSADLQETIADDLLASDTDPQEMHEALRGCLALLKPKDRQLLLHRYGTPSTLAEFAEKVGRSVGGLKVTLHRLRNKLLDCILRKVRTVQP